MNTKRTEHMTLQELIKRVSKGYETAIPESPLTEQVYPDGTPLTIDEYEDRGCGDTLARFIVVELAETYDPDAVDADQIKVAAHVISRARRDLDNVLDALSSA